MRARHRVRLAVNLVNGSTLAGLAVSLAGRARLSRCRDGLLAGTGYRLPVPAVPAFTMGNVIITRLEALDLDSDLFRHEARHTTQYAWCGGLLMLPLYFAAGGVSWLLSGNTGAWNPFERGAGLAAGGYRPAPVRAIWTGRPAAAATGLPAAAGGDRDHDRGPGEPAGSSASPSR